MTICDLCYERGTINDAPETCIECGADMCPHHGEGEFCLDCVAREHELVLSPAAACLVPCAQCA
jgi:hypothetical protein